MFGIGFPDVAGVGTGRRNHGRCPKQWGLEMKKENKFEYEKPELSSYRFAEKVAVGDSDPEDIPETCDSSFDA